MTWSESVAAKAEEIGLELVHIPGEITVHVDGSGEHLGTWGTLAAAEAFVDGFKKGRDFATETIAEYHAKIDVAKDSLDTLKPMLEAYGIDEAAAREAMGMPPKKAQ